MTENLPTETPKTPLPRKALILAGAAAGIIIAGGYAIFKKNTEQDDEVTEDAAE